MFVTFSPRFETYIYIVANKVIVLMQGIVKFGFLLPENGDIWILVSVAVIPPFSI